MTAAPDRAISFLLTDIEGSTRLWEEQPGAMAVALETHDQLLRRVIEASGGLVVKSTGDGLLATFRDVAAAIDAATTGQRVLAEEEWPTVEPLRVRMAIHAGAVESRDGDFHGPTLNRVARLLGIGHGGQVLVSETVAAAVGSAQPLIDHGAHRLRDIERPEHVFEVRTMGSGSFPALRSESRSRSNVPQQLTSFIGRTNELAELEASTGRDRLVTLVGVGGTGKTRLMLEAAARLQDREVDGAWLVELAPLADPDAVALEVARALGLSPAPNRPVIETLVDFLRTKELDLLLDNCEHVISAVAALCHRLLADCPRLRVVATSREPLAIAGEHVFAVPSMPLPPSVPTQAQASDGPDPATLEAIAASDAVKLFVDRASAIDPRFALGVGNAAAVVEICRRLDGIPLALELAASRISVLSVHEIQQRLSDRFRLLTGGRRTAMPRQQTLKALIDWSWDLLDDSDRRMLRRLSVFAGGWTLDAAASVTMLGDAGDPSLEVLDGLTRLADRSLITVQRGEATRYGMLETIRQYARDHLLESGETEPVRDAHLAWVVRLAIDAEPHLHGPDLLTWFARLDVEVDNIRVAIDWAFEADQDAALQLCVLLLQYWNLRSPSGEVLSWLARSADVARELRSAGGLSRDRSAWVARALSGAALGWSLWASGESPEMWAREGLGLARASGDPVAILEGVMGYGLARAFRGGLAELNETREELRERAAQLGQWWRIGYVEAAAAMAWPVTGLEVAEANLERAREAALRSRDPSTQAYVAAIHGAVAAARGAPEEARRWYREALAAYEELGSRRFQLIAHSDLAHALRRLGQLDEAEAEYRETIVGWFHEGARGAVANQLEAFAFLAIARGQWTRAARILGAAEALRAAADAVMMPQEQREYDEAIATLGARGVRSRSDAAWLAGRELGAQEAVDLALER